MQTRNANKTARHRLILAGCALAVATSAGCKSAAKLPGASMFGFNKTPSPETLAGEGPSYTYPAPPSQSSTPRAYDSSAAGIAGEYDLGTPSSPEMSPGLPPGGIETPSQGNGYGDLAQNYGIPGTGSTYTGTPSTNYGSSTSGGYDLGSYPPAAGGVAATPPSSNPTTPQGGYGLPSAGTAPGATPSYNLPPTDYSGIAGTQPGATPGNSFEYSTPSPGYATPGYTTPGMGTSGPQARVAQQPNASTIAPPPGIGVPPSAGSPSSSPYGNPPQVSGGMGLPPAGTTAPSAPSGYRPGSTAGATSYPSTPYTPSTGSMLR